MSIDIITLAASKNYTDKQIEKASIGGADVSQNADWNAAKGEPGYILNRPMEVSRANSINFPQFTLDNPQVGVYKVHDIPNITSETQHNYEHDIHFNSIGLKYEFYRYLKSKYGDQKTLDTDNFVKRENVHMIGGINYYIAFSTFYNVYFIIDVENLNAEYVTKFSNKGIYIEILVDMTAKGYDVSYNIETYNYTKLDPKFLPESQNAPLTFTGAVNATYDGSEAVSVEIPQDGGGESYYVEYTLTEAVTSYSIPIDTEKYNRYIITIFQPNTPVSPSVSFVRAKLTCSAIKDAGTSPETYFFVDLVECKYTSNEGTKMVMANSRRSNNFTANTLHGNAIYYLTNDENCIKVYGETLGAGTVICVRCWQ